MFRVFFVVLIAISFVSCTKNKKIEEKSQELTLTQQLEQKAQASADKTPEEIRKVMSSAIEELKASTIVEKALKKGDKIPEFVLKDVQKGEISSQELLKKGPLVISFYRGGWCPYCNLQLRDLQKHLGEFKAEGAQLVAISPEKPDSTAETIKKQELEFYVLSDSDGKVGEKFGLMFKLPEDLKQVYKKFGIDLEQANGNKDWELPIAATYIVNRKGEIVYSFVDEDYKKRAETRELVKIVRGL